MIFIIVLASKKLAIEAVDTEVVVRSNKSDHEIGCPPKSVIRQEKIAAAQPTIID